MTDTRTRGDWAHFVRDPVDGRYRAAAKVVLVMDQLNTHGATTCASRSPPAEARRLAGRLGIHHMP